MAQPRFHEVRLALNQLMEAVLNTTPDKRARLEECAREFARAVDSFKKQLEGLPGAGMSAKDQEAELTQLKAMEATAVQTLALISESFRESEFGTAPS